MLGKLDRGASENDDRFEGVGELFEPLNKVRQLRNFGKTFAAVTRGDPLYDFDKQRLQKEGYLGPWQFNALQSTLSGLPAVIIPFVARLFGVSGPEGGEIPEFLQSFAIPFILMFTAYVVGRASLWKRDASIATRKRAGRIFLYLDGAYGFGPQLCGCAVLTLFLLFPDVGFIKVMISAVSIQTLVVYMKTIPDLLFPALGYLGVSQDTSITLFATQSKPQETLTPRSEPPKWKYRLCVLIVVPLITVTVIAVIAFIGILVHVVSGKA